MVATRTIGGRFRQGLVITLVLGLAVYIFFGVRGEWQETAEALGSFAWNLLPWLLLLSLGNYLVRFVRWEIYLRMLGIRVPLGSSLAVFLAGLAMTITPGKVGEFLKSYLLKEEHGIPMARSAPVVFVERVGDLLSLLLLIALGLGTLVGREGMAEYRSEALALLALAGAGIVAVIVVLQSQRLTGGVLGFVARLPVGGRIAPKVGQAVEASRELLGARALVIGLALATLAWFFECAGYWLAFGGFGVEDFELGVGVFAYSFSTVAGVVTPGGVGVTDAGLITIAQTLYEAPPGAAGLELSVATAASFLVRLCTLWFAVAIGALALLRFRDLTAVDVDEARGTD